MKFVFVGNRRFVLEEMLKKNVNISKVLVIANTHLEKDIKEMDVFFSIIHSKDELLKELTRIDFDILIANGCPYILPISKMPPKKYVNIHPSYLPDLKGADPTIGSIMFERDSGATCHIMNDGIDSGDIIDQVKIPYTDDLDVSLLYQLSFIAEKKVFSLAYEKGFIPQKKQVKKEGLIYYSRKLEDKQLSFKKSIEEMNRQIRAFQNKSQGCEFNFKGIIYKVHQMEILNNPFLIEYAYYFSEFQVILNYEDCIVFKKGDNLILLRSFTDNLSAISVGKFISQ